MQLTIDRSVGDKAYLAVVNTSVLDHNRALQIHIGSAGERDAVLSPVDQVFDRIEVDLHDLM